MESFPKGRRRGGGSRFKYWDLVGDVFGAFATKKKGP